MQSPSTVKAENGLFNPAKSTPKLLPVLAGFSHKGGVGKTTTLRIIGETIAAHLLPEYMGGKKRILFIDFDPQGNTSSRYLPMESTFHNESGFAYNTPPKNLHPVLLGDPNQKKYEEEGVDEETALDAVSDICDLLLDDEVPVPYRTELPHVDVLPSDGIRLATELSMISDPEERQQLIFRLRDWLQSEDVKKTYAMVLFDNPPAQDFVTSVTMNACTHAYIPMVPEVQSVNGMEAAYSAISNAYTQRTERYPLKFLCILPVMYNKRTIEHGKQFRRVLEMPFGKHVLYTKNHRGKKEPQGFPKMICYAATDDISSLPKDILGKEGGTTFKDVHYVVNNIARQLGLAVNKRKPTKKPEGTTNVA